MHLRLLQQEHRGPFVPEELGEDRQHLADAVPHIDQITRWPLDSSAAFPYPDLKRFAASLSEGPDRYLVEQSGLATEALQSGFQDFPRPLFFEEDLGKVNGDVLAFRIAGRARRVVGPSRLRANGRAGERPVIGAWKMDSAESVDEAAQLLAVFPGDGGGATPRHCEIEHRAPERSRAGADDEAGSSAGRSSRHSPPGVW